MSLNSAVLRAVASLCASPPRWLLAAAGSIATCSAAFVVGPRLVPWLLREHATLTFRNQKDKDSSGGRYVTLVHAIAVSVINTYLLVFTDVFDDSPSSKDQTPVMLRHTPLSEASLGMSAGYFLLDAALVAYYMPAMGGVEMLTHHIAAFLSVLATLGCGESHMYTMALIATEWTTPFINFRWLLDKMGWKETRLYKANGVALLCSWMVMRIALFVWFFIHLYSRQDQLWRTHWPVRYLLVVVPPMLSILNLMWFEKILRGVLKAFFKKGSKKLDTSEGTDKERSKADNSAKAVNGYPLKSE